MCRQIDTKAAALQGTPGAAYDVTIRFRGIVEQKTYTGGVEGRASGPSNADLFEAGGTPDTTAFNRYELDISDPEQTFFLNSGSSGSDFVFLIDYVATIRINGGATVTLVGDSIESLENPNRGTNNKPVLVPGVPPAPATYDGQFVQMDVESVVRAP